MKTRIQKVVFVILVVGALILSQCSYETNRDFLPASNQYTNGDILVTPTWLNEHLDSRNMMIIDMRSADVYSVVHVPGAVNVPVSDITSTVNGVPFEFDLDKVQATLNRIGLKPDMTVVIYDDLGMLNSSRFFWTLEYVGHKDVRVLHGGWNAWVASKFETADQQPALTESNYPIRLDPSKLVTADEVQQALGNPDIAIVDSRSPDEYSGKIKYADRGGHIPGAVNLPWLNVLTGGNAVYTTQDGWQAQLQDEDVELFKTQDKLQTIIGGLGLRRGQEVITYCQTLWRGAHTYFLLRLMGFQDVRGYDGSWAEWGNRPDLPVVTGDQPGSLDTAQ